MLKPHLLFCTLLLVALYLLPNPHSIYVMSAVAQTAPTTKADERERGIELYRQENYAEAAKFLRRAVDENKLDEQSWFYLGLALIQQPKEIKNASKAFETAIKLRPNFAAAHAGLSYSFLKRDKFSEALRAARAALKIDPRIANAHYTIGVIRLNAGSYEEALKEAREAIRLNPNLALAYLIKSLALVESYAAKVMESRGSAVPTAMPPTPQERAERRQRWKEAAAPLKEAAESLETYLRLNPSDPSAELWREQLNTLQVFSNLDADKTDTEAVVFGDEVSTKVRVLHKPEPQFTDQARSARTTGTVVLRAVFGVDGRVRHILIIKALPNGLTERAIEAAKRIRFTPATTIDGKPVSMFIQLEYNFNLR